MQDRELHRGWTLFSRLRLIAASLLARLTGAALVGLMKIPTTGEPTSSTPPDSGVLEIARLCEILKQLGGGRGAAVPAAEPANGDLVEKNMFLRTVNEEIIKLTQSLEVANTELEETKDYLNNLIQNSADMIVSTGRRRIITLFNRRAEDVLGYTSDELIGRPIDILYQTGEVESVENQLKQQPDGKLMEHEIKLKTKGGVIIPARLTASLLYDRSGKLVGSVGACTDLTHVKALENELLMQQKLLAIAELGGAASHELNQPLTVALGRIQLIFRKEGQNCPFHRDLIHVEKELERLAEMVRRIGQITRYKTKPYIGHSRIIDLERAVVPQGEEKDHRGQFNQNS